VRQIRVNLEIWEELRYKGSQIMIPKM